MSPPPHQSEAHDTAGLPRSCSSQATEDHQAGAPSSPLKAGCAPGGGLQENSRAEGAICAKAGRRQRNCGFWELWVFRHDGERGCRGVGCEAGEEAGWHSGRRAGLCGMNLDLSPGVSNEELHDLGQIT